MAYRRAMIASAIIYRLSQVVLCTIGLIAVASWLLLRDNASRSPLRWSVSILLPIIVAVRGMMKKSLDFSGAMLAILVGFVLTASSACFCTSLLTFFITSSLLTKWKGEEKRKLDPEFREGAWARLKKCPRETHLLFSFQVAKEIGSKCYATAE